MLIALGLPPDLFRFSIHFVALDALLLLVVVVLLLASCHRGCDLEM